MCGIILCHACTNTFFTSKAVPIPNIRPSYSLIRCIIITTLDRAGDDLACLTPRSGMDIWDNFCVPKLRSKQLTGNTHKVYLRSMQFFVTFISKGLRYDKAKLKDRHKEVIIRLRDKTAGLSHHHSSKNFT